MAEQRYLKSALRFVGANVPTVRRITKAFGRAHPDLTRVAALALVEALWAEPVHERRLLAVFLLQRYSAVLTAEDISPVERLLREAKTWALVDGLAESIAGALLERYPEVGVTLDRWSTDGDFWLRRASLLATLPGVKRDEAAFERFAGYADAMLGEREFFIRKAIGWVLRETGKRRPEQVFAWLAPRTDRASGVTVREAIKYLPPERGEALLDAYLEKRALL
jgi:3-methyladenine DNA glycosylase AlkD